MSDAGLIEIFINGEKRAVGKDGSLLSLIEELNLEPARVALELNLEIVPRKQWTTTILKADDRLEIVHFVGGG